MNPSTFLDPRFPMRMSERWKRLGEWAVLTVAWRLPRRLVYWTVIRAAVAAAGNDRNPADVTSSDMLNTFEKETDVYRR
jgi:hypothetical protein